MQPRAFVSQFLLPLVRGGSLAVGRLLSVADVQSLIQSPIEDPLEHAAASALAVARQKQLAQLVPNPPLPVLDPATWRLGAVVHNLLAMSHPRVGAGAGAEGRIERIAAVTVGLATLGPPPTLSDVLTRYSLLARLPEVARHDHTVHHRLGKRTFVGQRPPGRALALARLRGVSVESARRTWLRDVGVPVAARSTFIALTEASPLGEALDPLRLDPPPSWGRLLSVLRFPILCRAVAGRLFDMGVARVGDSLTEALYRFVSLQDAAGPTAASAGGTAYGIQFLAHLVWLDVLFGESARPSSPDRDRVFHSPAALPHASPSSSSMSSPSPSTSRPDGSAGVELAVLLTAAQEIDPTLIWPRDVTATSDMGRRFALHLEGLSRRQDVRNSPRWVAACAVAEFAVAQGAPEVNAI
jgi:hypothetical protein